MGKKTPCSNKQKTYQNTSCCWQGFFGRDPNFLKLPCIPVGTRPTQNVAGAHLLSVFDFWVVALCKPHRSLHFSDGASVTPPLKENTRSCHTSIASTFTPPQTCACHHSSISSCVNTKTQFVWPRNAWPPVSFTSPQLLDDALRRSHTEHPMLRRADHGDIPTQGAPGARPRCMQAATYVGSRLQRTSTPLNKKVLATKVCGFGWHCMNIVFSAGKCSSSKCSCVHPSNSGTSPGSSGVSTR